MANDFVSVIKPNATKAGDEPDAPLSPELRPHRRMKRDGPARPANAKFRPVGALRPPEAPRRHVRAPAIEHRTARHAASRPSPLVVNNPG